MEHAPENGGIVIKKIAYSAAIVILLDAVMYMVFASRTYPNTFLSMILFSYALIPILMYLSDSAVRIWQNMISTIIAVIPAIIGGAVFIGLPTIILAWYLGASLLISVAFSIVIVSVLKVRSKIRHAP